MSTTTITTSSIPSHIALALLGLSILAPLLGCPLPDDVPDTGTSDRGQSTAATSSSATSMDTETSSSTGNPGSPGSSSSTGMDAGSSSSGDTGPLPCAFPPGEWFGPCRGTCFGGMCIITTTGNICLPPCGACGDANAVDCSGELTTTDDLPLVCLDGPVGCGVPCTIDGDADTCDGGTACDPRRLICVWPP